MALAWAGWAQEQEEVIPLQEAGSGFRLSTANIKIVSEIKTSIYLKKNIYLDLRLYRLLRK